MAAPRLVIFDLDGTLIDSMQALGDWLWRATAGYRAETVTVDDIIAAFGPVEAKLLARFVPGQHIPRCLDTYYRISREEQPRVNAYPGVPEMLRHLRQAWIKLALCTGKSRAGVRLNLEAYGWHGYFNTIMTGDDTTVPKPAPEGLALILDSIPCPRQHVLFVGDSIHDIAAARAAHIHSAYAAWGYGGETAPPDADYSFRTPHALTGFILRQQPAG